MVVFESNLSILFIISFFRYDMTSAAKFLLERGAQVGLKSDYGTTSLAFACRRGNVELVDLLLEKNPGLVDVGDNSDVSRKFIVFYGQIV